MDREVSRSRRPLSRDRPRNRARGGAAHRCRRPRSPGRSLDAYERRETGHPGAEAGARANHARRKRGHGRPLDDRLQADRPLRRRAGEPGVPDRDAAAMDGCVYPYRHIDAGSEASVSTRSAWHRCGYGRHRRIREPDETFTAVPCLWREVLARIPARVSRSRRFIRHFARPMGALLAAAGIAADRCAVPAARARRRGEPGALCACRFRSRSDAVSAASTARSRRSTWGCPSSRCRASVMASARRIRSSPTSVSPKRSPRAAREYADIAARLADGRRVHAQRPRPHSRAHSSSRS